MGNCSGKTLPADQITWQGLFGGQPICVISTVRLSLGNLAHSNVNSGARIGAHSWNLPGGHYIDLAVESRPDLSDEDLMSIGRLSAAVDDRQFRVRRRAEHLADGRQVITAVGKKDGFDQTK
ncbi:MAG TPA: hypothetical protein VGX94_01810 [Terriglobia bacterium]|nr:hypothetical protein [Terriglobia bacterium]